MPVITRRFNTRLSTLVPIKTFIEQVKRIEGIDIRIKDNRTGFEVKEGMVKSYDYDEPMPDEASVAELWHKRIKPCLKSYMHVMYKKH